MFTPNLEAAASGADVIFLCLGNDAGGGLRAAGRRPSWSTSPASTGSPTRPPPSSWYGLDAGRVELRAAGGAPGRGAADREPRLLRDRGAARARPAARGGRPATSIVDAKSGHDRRRPDAQGQLARGRRARELLALRRRRAPARAEIEQELGFPVSFVPHLLPVRRGLLATCYLRTDADVRALLEAGVCGQPGRARAARGDGAGDRARPGHRRGRDRRLRRPARPAWRS